jgi:hypothetical protein
MAAVAATPQKQPVAVPQEKQAAKPVSTKRKTPWSRVLVPLAACCAIVILLQGRLSFGSAKSEEAPAAGEYAFMMDSASPMEAAKAEEAAVEMETPAAPMPETEAYAEPVEVPAQAKKTTPTSNDAYEFAAQESDTVDFSHYRIRIDVDAAYIGDTLDGYTPVIEADSSGTGRTELHYELTMAQYEDLLHALADRNELPAEEEFETDSDLVLVIVH